MKRELRFFAGGPALALILATAACDGDVKPVGDVLASDSTLALEVFGATPDSVQGIGDTIAPVDSIAIPMVASSEPVSAPVAARPSEPAEASGRFEAGKTKDCRAKHCGYCLAAHNRAFDAD